MIHVRMEPNGLGDITLDQAIAALLLAKAVANLRKAYLKSLASYLRQFAFGRGAMLVAEISASVIENWFAARSEAPSTRASNLGRLSALFGFCERRGWIARNPCRAIDRPRIDTRPPTILTPEQSTKLIQTIRTRRPHMLPFFALGLFAGVRPDELARLSWSAIDLPRGILTIDAAASKTRRRRIVHLPEAASRLLTNGGRLPVSRATRRRYTAFACAILAFEEWPHDLLRHTAASYLLAQHRDAARVAMTLGNSPSVLLRRYYELVSPEDCAKFWACKG